MQEPSITADAMLEYLFTFSGFIHRGKPARVALPKDHFTSVFSKRYAPRNSMAPQQTARTAKSTAGERALVPIRLYLKPSTPYVRGLR